MAGSGKQALRELYYGESRRSHQFRFALLGFDTATILFLILSSFMRWSATERSIW